MSLPTDFPYNPPQGYSYETQVFKTNIISIWIRNHARFSYTNDPVKSIWGFYNIKKRCYIAPINHKRPGKIVDVKSTSAYSAMPLLKLALDPTDDVPSPAMINSSTKETTLSPTFTEFKAQQDARNANQLNVTKYALMLCDALQQNYQCSHPTGRNYSYALVSGRKYHKVMQCIDGNTDSVHAFIDRKSGEVYKPASIKQPAKGVRFNLLIITEREWLFENADWAGGYLYRRG